MQNYKEQFRGKKITIMGLGILGRGLGYTKFLAECGADLTVTDLKTKKELVTSVKVLSKYKGIKFVLGKHRLEDFRNRDMIIKAAGVPLDSIFIKEAKKNKIPVEMDVSHFAKCAPEVMIVGVTGTRGKSMTTALIYEILSAFAKASAGQGKPINKFWANKPRVFLGGNVRGVATLPLLEKVKAGDILVCELDSWQLQGF
jgi:UDP-N-acetylmuramoylalanine--D-glutamate ligase